MKLLRKKTDIVILSAAVLACVAFVGLMIYRNAKQLVIEFYEAAEINVNEAADIYQFVKRIENGKILTENLPIDTSHVGKQSVSLTVKPVFGSKQVFEYSVSVVDHESPHISFANRVKTAVGNEIDLLKEVIVTDNSKETIVATVEGFYDIQTVGNYLLKYVACDSSRNETKEEFILSVVDEEGPHISFTDHLRTDVGNAIDLLEGVSATDNSKEEITVAVEGSYDFQTVGDYPLKYVAYDSSHNKTEEAFLLSVEDHECPVITFSAYLETAKGKKIDLLAGVSATDNSGEEITVTVEGSYDINRAGTYQLKYVAYDSSMNKAEETFTLRVKDNAPATPVPNVTIEFTTSKGFSGVTKNGVTYIDGYLIANKTYSLPSTYGNGLTAETLSAFNTMAAAAKKDGLNIYISSGFRSYSRQKAIYKNYVNRDGVAKADTYSARAGYSEHQSGLAFDVNIISSAFAGTPEAIWLADNCYRYGFILRYPQGKTNETGYIYEPWHFRYVGVELAEKLYNGGNWITMEEYFGITSTYQ